MAIKGYTELEYIQSTGSQFIGIDYIPKTLHTKYELGFMRTGTSGYWNPIINSEEDVRFGIMCTIDGNNSSNYGQFHIGPAGRGFKSVQFPISSDIKYDIIADKTGISLNGIKYSVSGVGDATGSWSTYINHRLTSNTAFSPEYSIGRWYYLKVYEDDGLIKDFIPVKRKSDNVLGMYEKLEDKFYINSGTGNFIAGPEVFDGSQLQQNLLQIQEELNTQLDNMYIAFPELYRPYIELEYIESTGTQYIDMNTANILVDGCCIEASLSFASPTERQCIFGTEVASPFYRNYLFKTSSGFECGAYNYNNISYSVEVNQVLAIDYSTVKGNNYLKNNNSTIWSNKDNNDRASTSSYLFAFHHRFNYAQAFAKMKLYYFKMYNSNNELIRDFIPVKRKSDNEICMYDKVTNQFFTNQGTGNFIAGPEVN